MSGTEPVQTAFPRIIVPGQSADFARLAEEAARSAEKLGYKARITRNIVDPSTQETTTARRTLGAATVRSVVGSKWTVDIMMELLTEGPRGFEDLRRSLFDENTISPRVLSLVLKTLEEHHLIDRHILGEHPPRVAYVLTDRGHTLSMLLLPFLAYAASTEEESKE